MPSLNFGPVDLKVEAQDRNSSCDHPSSWICEELFADGNRFFFLDKEKTTARVHHDMNNVVYFRAVLDQVVVQDQMK